ncbi:MAG: flagellar basal body L-ring protein FlgH [Fibromonadaceae bacterium]|jgi:flagellar L-ring protein precursor FlgH|nr:flagellar basal body L-ring protein FlgH [Fibromonadaceae bacterium]
MKLNSLIFSNLRLTLLVLGALAISAMSAPSLYGNSLYGSNLYTDKKGKKAGDVVTVLIIEAAKAGSDTRTETEKKNNLSIGQEKSTGSKLFSWIPTFGVNGNANMSYDGKGATARNGELKATVTARITEVLDNGNLLIEGSKVVAINDEEEILEVSGTIRADDINPDNTVYSYKIAEAIIRYSGSGTNSQAAKPGLFTRFFNWIF